MSFMLPFIGPAIGAISSIAGGAIGAAGARKGMRAGVKAGKGQGALAKQLVYGTPASGRPGTPGYRPAVAGSEAQYGTDIATQNKVLADQQAASKAAYTAQNRLLTQGQGQVSGALQPYMDVGKQAIAAQQGQFGGPDAQGYIDRFKSSPDYLLNYGAAIQAGEEGLGANFSPGGSLNSGAIRKALQGNAVDVTNRFVNQYADRIGQGIATGMDAAGRYVDASGRLVGLGMESAGQFGAGQRADLGAYGTNTAALGQNRLNAYGQSLGGQGAALGNIATAKAGGAAGVANAWNSALQGVTTAAGGLPEGYGGAKAPVYNYGAMAPTGNFNFKF